MSMLSSSQSGSSSPRSCTVTARSDSRERPSSFRPRSPRAASDYQYPGHITSENGSKVRQFDSEDRPYPPPRSAAGKAPADGKPGLSPIRTERSVHSFRTKVRSYSPIDPGSPSSSSCNEAPDPSLLSGEATTRFPQLPNQATHPVRGLASGKQTQVPVASPVSPVFPSSLSSSSTPPHRPCTPDRRTPTLITGQSSIESTGRVQIPDTGLSTPSASPRSRKSASNSSTPSRRPPFSVLIRQALVPARGPPTLAMSMQIHAPSPIISTRPMPGRTNTQRQSRSLSRSSSPLSSPTHLPNTRPPMARPPSRSEKLLRNTLRKVEEHDKLMALSALPSPSLFGATQPAHGFMTLPPPNGRRSRRATSSSITTDASLDAFAYCDTGACDSDEEEEEYDEVGGARWLLRSSSSSSSSSGHGASSPHHQPLVSRHFSDDNSSWRITAYGDRPDASAYTMPSSPRQARMQLQRSAHSAPIQVLDGERSMRAPHDAVLRSRLEGVLKGARDHTDRTTSRERGYSGESGSSNSMASSRNLSSDGDWPFGAGEQPLVSSPTSAGMESPSMRKSRSRANTTSHGRSLSSSTNPALRSPQTAGAQLPAHVKQHGLGPLTPPPTPPFNARTAAEQCKAMNGYVSFATIEGLGVPGGEVDFADDEEDKGRGHWLKWLSIGQTKSTRGRSGSVTSH